jgi:DNA-binding CsgD family transcriptional regulator
MKRAPSDGTTTPQPEHVRERAVLSMVESAYDVDLPYGQWARALLERMMAVLVPVDIGGFVCRWTWPRSGALNIDSDSAVAIGAGSTNSPRIFEGLHQAVSPWMHRTLYTLRSLGSCILTSEFDPHRRLAYRAQLEAEGIADGVNLVGWDLDERGILLSLGVPKSFEMTPTIRESLTRAATHILAGLRLRNRLLASGATERSRADAVNDPEAILSTEGRVLHARGAARMAVARRELESAVRLIEGIRDGTSSAPALSLRSWKGLVGARWSLVDTFERNGERYVVARENRPQPLGKMIGLTRTQSSVVAYMARGLTTKETAYTLGISDATVRVLVMRAVQRCGFENRRDLLEAWKQKNGLAEDGAGSMGEG